MKTLKVVSIAILAALSLSAIAASTASAEFTTTSNGTTVLAAEATEAQTLEVNGGTKVSCPTIAIDGNVTGTKAESITVEPTYSGCSISIPEAGTFPAFIDSNGCTYIYTIPEEARVGCPGKEAIITVTVELVKGVKSKCLEIGEQTPTTPRVSYGNNAKVGSEMDFEIESAIEGITYTDLGVCGSSTHDDGSSKGKITVKGSALIGGEAVGLTEEAEVVPPPEFTTTNDGTTNLTAEALETQVFTTAAGIEVKCKAVGVDGSISGTDVETITVEPTYSNCEITIPGVGTKKAFVDAEGCHYLFTFNVEIHILCPASKKMVITAELVPNVKSKCLEIGEQTPTTPNVDYSDNTLMGNQMDFEIESTLAGITYNKAGPCGSAENNDMSITGKVTIKGHDSVSAEAVGVTEGPETSPESEFTTTNNGTTVLTAETTETQVFKNVEGVEFKCTSVAFDGSISGTTAETATVEPTYSGCTVVIPGVGTVNAFIDAEGCHYLFTANTQTHILCPTGKKITVTGEFVKGVKSKCLEIGAQTPTTPEVHYINNLLTGTEMDFEIESTLAGITYNKAGPCGSAENNDMSIAGKVTIKGKDSVTGAQVGVTRVS